MADIRSFFGGPKKPAPKADPSKQTETRASSYFSVDEEDEDVVVVKKQKKPETKTASATSSSSSSSSVPSSIEKKKRKKIVDDEEEEDEENLFEKPRPLPSSSKTSAPTTTQTKKPAHPTPPEKPLPPPSPPVVVPMDASTFFGTNDVKPLIVRPKKKIGLTETRTKQELDDASLALALQLQDREERRASKPSNSSNGGGSAKKGGTTSPYFGDTPTNDTITTPPKKTAADKPEVVRRSPRRTSADLTEIQEDKKPSTRKSSLSPSASSARASSVKSETATPSSSSSTSTSVKKESLAPIKQEPSVSSAAIKHETPTAAAAAAAATSTTTTTAASTKQELSAVKQETKPSLSPARPPRPSPSCVGGSPPAVKKNSSFAAYKHRGGPPMAGQVEYPEGAPYCLAGLTFVMTGVLDSLDAEGFKELIQKHGGRVTGDVSGKTSYLVRGAEPGEGKSAKATEKNIPMIDEAGLLELIRTLPENVPGGDKGGKKSKKAKLALSPAKPEPSKREPMSISNDTPRSSSSSSLTITNNNNNSHEEKKSSSSLSSSLSSSISSSSSSSSSYTNNNKLQDPSGLLWVDKYKPSDPSQIIGNNENVNRITVFLRTWQQTFLEQKGTTNTKRAVLISGPPGTGKTTGTTAIARSLGYEVIEFNASDLRNQAAIEQQISELAGNRAMTEFYRQDQGNGNNKSRFSKTCLIMDEVDGMSGSDRGGIAKLITIIKKSKIPIVCICNDGKDRKLQSLKNYCLDISWRRPQSRSVAEKLVKIAQGEGLSIDIPSVERMCEMTHVDIRQVLHLIQLWAKNDTKVSYDEAKNRMSKAEKDFDLGPFDVCNKFFQVPVVHGPKKWENWLDDRIDAYFVDADLLPLMVHQNYLSCKPAIGRHGELKAPPGKEPPKPEIVWMESFATAADYISWGDIMSNKLRTENDWSLAPAVGVLSTVAPGATVAGGMTGGMMGFPAWLGKNSTTNKNLRLVREISTVMSLDCPCSSRDMGLYYLPLIRYQLLAPMVQRGVDGIEDVLNVMKEYGLTRDDWADIVELGEGFSEGLRQSDIGSAIKATFSRHFNGHPILAKVTRPADKNFKPTKVKGEGGGSQGDEIGIDEDDEEGVAGGEEEEEEESIEKDKSIKVLKTPAGRGGKAGGGAKGKKDESKTKAKAASNKKTTKETKPRIPKKK